MKVIISHDVDHLHLKEHLSDTFLPGLLLRSGKSILKGGISLGSMMKRFPSRLNNVQSLHEFNRQYGVRETFFFGMRNGLNLSYQWQAAKPLISYLVQNNVLVGLHGMAFDDEALLKEEKARLQSMLPENYPVGIRNHYLRKNDETLAIMSRIGFLYDSTEYVIEAPHRINNMWEIPISIMDAGFLSNFKNDMQALRQRTLQKIDEAEQLKLPFFVINFHDIFFSDGYPDFRNWYQWLIKYFFEKGYQYINFKEAVSTLNEPVAG